MIRIEIYFRKSRYRPCSILWLIESINDEFWVMDDDGGVCKYQGVEWGFKKIKQQPELVNLKKD